MTDRYKSSASTRAEWPKGADFTMEVEEFRLYATEVMGLPAPANRSGLISFAIAAQQQGGAT